MFNVGVMVKVPLSGWWEGSYKRNSARAETRIKSLELQDAREKVELQVNQSVYKVNEANKKLIVSTRNMENAEENLRHANLGFEEGVIPADAGADGLGVGAFLPDRCTDRGEIDGSLLDESDGKAGG